MTVLSDTPAPPAVAPPAVASPAVASPAVTPPEVPVDIGAVQLSPAPLWPVSPLSHEEKPTVPNIAAADREAEAKAAPGAVLPGGPVHCGELMPVRQLDPLAPDSRANQAVFEAAAAGQRVHACACGHLQCAPADPVRPQPLCTVGEQSVFTGLFLRGVHAAAAVAESARWSFDQVLADAPAGTDAAARWLFDADLESAAWALDAAELDLQEVCALATAHGVDAKALTQITGTGDEEIETTGSQVPGTTEANGVQVTR